MLAHSAISPFVLTRELLPVLKQTAAEPDSDVRVVVVRHSGWCWICMVTEYIL
jgi:hypothetical protein